MWFSALTFAENKTIIMGRPSQTVPNVPPYRVATWHYDGTWWHIESGKTFALAENYDSKPEGCNGFTVRSWA